MSAIQNEVKILADQNIPFVSEAFATLGHVVTHPGREITPESISDADVLLVRSVTKVGPELLAGSSVKLVATATIGHDHIDVPYLDEQGIGFASAPGSNANSVAEYVFSALCVLSRGQDFNWRDKTVGMIGCGNVGSNLLKKLRGLDVECLVNDPPLQEHTGGPDFVTLEDILSCDIVTLHVPLEFGGRYPTYRMVDEAFLSSMRTNSVLINTSRGSVVDEKALLEWLDKAGHVAVLDVWENEPRINTKLLEKVKIGTPHIAGYSYDGKVRGTQMVYEATCEYFNIPPTWNPQDQLPTEPVKQRSFSEIEDDNEVIETAILASYDVRRDDASLRKIDELPHEERTTYFDSLRRDYPIRREFHCTQISIPEERTGLANKLKALGFKVVLRRI
ncbi:4-phosphoerythronate dehydrogenase [candidate division KSB1 bacterium]|nr:4-phosphoerythronate dehydrogenase [candidate division KSB1 bacterium]NIR72604.1 4-phosphoerythronate dehydrogenase [candidate division KSB1 bacterium]NIS23982.1 4-phosphoerythronate dehydrogenase [candidate division KSB1 bacterium]NIT70905.1 4-phosphoerythronate dehydrogenase [candidate division KSB1 bacterium]NIU24632.1 4-phosphoerythronate dehydrogenase [candidate division KSB1 bacterium]